jgi:hypothetical protein
MFKRLAEHGLKLRKLLCFCRRSQREARLIEYEFEKGVDQAGHAQTGSQPKEDIEDGWEENQPYVS